MEAKDQSVAFDFSGTFTEVTPHQCIHFAMDDDRIVEITFSETDAGVLLTESFEAEDVHAAEQQRQGWQSILNNFKKHVESKNS